MSRLIAFGCSITYGHGLPDCFEPPIGAGPLPSKFAWPALLGNRLNKKTILNYGSPGASNLEILYKLLNQNICKQDLVVIYWSFYDRIDLVRLDPNISKVYRLRLEDLDKEFLSEEGYITHNFIRNYLLINHAALFLDQKEVPYYFLDRRSQNVDRIVKFPNYLRPKNYDDSQFDNYFRVDLALDGNHPGQKSQEKIADYLYNKITQQMYTNT